MKKIKDILLDVKEQMKNPAFFLIIVTGVLIIAVSIYGICSGDLINSATPTDANTTEITTEAASTEETTESSEEDTESTEEDTESTEETTESNKEKQVANEDNYISAITDVIMGTYSENTPVTDDCINSFENDYFNPEDVTSIEKVPGMCSFDNNDAVFNVTVNDEVFCYGIRFTLSVTGQINYINIYSIPYAEGEIDGGINGEN